MHYLYLVFFKICINIGIIYVGTLAQCHYDVCKQMLNAGKHVHQEKTLATSTDEAAPVLELAAPRRLLQLPHPLH